MSANKNGTLVSMKIAFLGTGRMGSELARHLLKSHEVTVWNRTAERGDGMRSAGAVLEQGGAKARVGGQKSELLGDVPGGTDRAHAVVDSKTSTSRPSSRRCGATYTRVFTLRRPS